MPEKLDFMTPIVVSINELARLKREEKPQYENVQMRIVLCGKE